MKKIHVFGTAPSFKAGTFMEVLEYSLGSTGVLLRKYWSTAAKVLEYFLGSTESSSHG